MFSRQLEEAMIPAWVMNDPEVVAARDAMRKARDERDAAEMADDFKRERAANKAFREADKAYNEIKKKVMNAPKEKAKMSALAKLGVYQICRRAFKLSGRGMTHHGWKEHGGGKGVRGYRAGQCPGVGLLPLQVTKKDLEDFVRQMEADPETDPKSPWLMDAKAVIQAWKPDLRWQAAVGFR